MTYLLLLLLELNECKPPGVIPVIYLSLTKSNITDYHLVLASLFYITPYYDIRDTAVVDDRGYL